MTTPEVQAEITEELRAADDALRAADALLALSLWRDAASRTSYAAFHAARALLFSAGVKRRSHEALRSLFARHFVKPGFLSADHSKLLGTLESVRLEGDYDTSFARARAQLEPELNRARELLEAARHQLRQSGWSA